MRKSLAIMIGILLVVGLLGALAPAWGQEVTAAIVGTVVDPSGAPIKGAAVVARDTERGTVWNAQTNDSGAFSILRLPVGTYTAEATSAGFEKTVYPPFTLVLNQTARLTFQMKVGKASEVVEVTGVAPILQTEDAQVSTVIDSNTVTSVALATRNYVQLTLLSPGAITVSPNSMNIGSNTAEEGGRPYINGNREQANNFLLDGVDNNQASDNIIGYTPSPDAIGEFNLITQNASAEFGNYNGGIVNVTPDLCTFRRSDSCVNSATNRGLAGMNLQLVDNTRKSVHRILCTDLQEVTDTAIVSGSRSFIGFQKEFCKAAMGAGFVLAA